VSTRPGRHLKSRHIKKISLTYGPYPSDGEDTNNGGFENYDLSAFDDEYGFDDSYGDQYDYSENALDTAVADETAGPGRETEVDREGTNRELINFIII